MIVKIKGYGTCLIVQTDPKTSQAKVVDIYGLNKWIGYDKIERKATRWEKIEFRNPNCNALQLGYYYLLEVFFGR